MKKTKQKTYSHIISKEKHSDFLSQDRQDSITHEVIEEGDEVVFCAICKSTFTLDSWQYIGNSRCSQSQTLKKIPVLRSLSFDKKKIEQRKKINLYRSKFGKFIAVCIFFGILGIAGMVINTLFDAKNLFSFAKNTSEEESYMQSGIINYNHQNYTQAQYFYQKVLKINPNNAKAQQFLEQLENEYLFILKNADSLFKAQNYQDAKFLYQKAILYKPSSNYSKNQLAIIIQSQAELPTLFIKQKDIKIENEYPSIEEFPKDLEEVINKNEKLYFWMKDSYKGEILLSYESGLIELKSYRTEPVLDENGNQVLKEVPKQETTPSLNIHIIPICYAPDPYEYVLKTDLVKTFRGKPNTKAVFVYPSLRQLVFDNTNQRSNTYNSIAILENGNKLHFYLMEEGKNSTFYFKENEKIIFSETGIYFLVQKTNKLLNLYDADTKTLLKSYQTNEDKPFIENAYFDSDDTQIIAHTEMGESRWEIKEIYNNKDALFLNSEE